MFAGFLFLMFDSATRVTESIPVIMTWRVLGLRVEETVSRCGG